MSAGSPVQARMLVFRECEAFFEGESFPAFNVMA